MKNKVIVSKPGGREQIEMSITTFKEKVYLDIRTFYKAGDSNEFKPTPKGVMIPIDLAPAIRSGLRELLSTTNVNPKVKTGATAAPPRRRERELDDEDRPRPAKKRVSDFGNDSDGVQAPSEPEKKRVATKGIR